MRARPRLSEYAFDQWASQLKDWIAESVSPFEGDTPEAQKARIARGKHDLLFFFKTYLPHYFAADFAECHSEWADVTQLRDTVALLAAPREHAKSTFFTLGDSIHDVVYALRWFILIISDTNDQATGFTLPIRLELEDNPRIRHDFGDLTGRTWKKNDFTTANGVRVLARGRGEKVRGLKNREHRPDKAYVDDYENDENVENPRLVTAGIKWLRRAVIGSMGAGYCFIMVGNLFHPKSVLSQLIAAKDEEGNPLYLSKIYDCWIDYGKPSQRPLWPALWPADRLIFKQRAMSTTDFNAEMRNLCGAEDSPFQEKWFVYYPRIELVMPVMRIAHFVDPSATSGEKADFKAVITVGLDQSVRDRLLIRVLHAWIRRATINEMFAAAYTQADHYGSGVGTGIEENMFKDFLHQAIQNYAAQQRKMLAWRPVHHSANKHGRIVGGLQYLVEYGNLQFCKGHSDQDVLVEQLIYLSNATVNDDGPDALVDAVALVQATAGDDMQDYGVGDSLSGQYEGAI